MKNILLGLCLALVLSGCTWTMFGLQSGTPGYYGLNEDGTCDELCKKVLEEQPYCDCN